MVRWPVDCVVPMRSSQVGEHIPGGSGNKPVPGIGRRSPEEPEAGVALAGARCSGDARVLERFRALGLPWALMASDLDPFYLDTLRRLVREGVMDPGSSLLCVCAGERDHRTLKEAGFPQVTLTNLETRWELENPGTHRVAYGDVENLTFPDKSFDFVVAHSGLHHCASPHARTTRRRPWP
ncbi:MAG: methyltransferase domain-containing protein [Proteobacteria bacterium]|nr:methyltransferase domain-containing protein [Pseudomonadota bacterium]